MAKKQEPPANSAEARKARAAAALRANLRRKKAQARGRVAKASPEQSDPPADETSNTQKSGD